MNSTIFALSTSFNKSAIAIVRVSGPKALDSLEKLTRLDVSHFTPFKVKLVTLTNPDTNEFLDKPLVLFFPSNKSYTGEVLVEYHLHGSIAVIEEILDILGAQEGHRLAYPGEFTKRAFLNNRMSLIEAEGLNDFINSETNLQKQQAYKVMTGEGAKLYTEWLDIIRDNLSLIEASIDFSDEDLPQDILSNVDNNLLLLKQDLAREQLKCSGKVKLKKGLNVSIVGFPNVGKSTLINFLTNTDTSIVSDIAGTTRDNVCQFVNIFGFPVKFIDTAGIRQTEDPLELIGIEKSVKSLTTCDLKIILLSANNFYKSFSMVEPYINGDYILIVNKIDLKNEPTLKEYRKFLTDKNLSAVFCSIKNEIYTDILQTILNETFAKLTGISDHPVIANERHKHIVNNLQILVSQAIEELDLVIKAHYLREGMTLLGELLGLSNIEDILDNIFSNFCIGK